MTYVTKCIVKCNIKHSARWRRCRRKHLKDALSSRYTQKTSSRTCRFSYTYISSNFLVLEPGVLTYMLGMVSLRVQIQVHVISMEVHVKSQAFVHTKSQVPGHQDAIPCQVSSICHYSKTCYNRVCTFYTGGHQH